MSANEHPLSGAPDDGTSPLEFGLEQERGACPQDRFDLLQTLVAIETEEVQPALVMAVESMSVAELTALSSESVTGLCA